VVLERPVAQHNGRVIVDCAVYRDGSRIALDSHRDDVRAACEALSGDGDYIWLGLYEPAASELEGVATTLGLHPLAVEDAVKAHQRPKLEAYDGGLFLVLKTLWYVDAEDAVETGEIAVFLGPRYLVTVRHGEGMELTTARRGAESGRSVLGHGPAAALYTVCDSVVDRYADVAAALEIDVEEVERSVFSNARARDSERIYRLKREVLEFRRAIGPLREPMHRLATGQVALVPTEAAPFFRDVADHLARVAEAVDGVDHLLDNVLNAHLARLSVQQNADMRRISAGATLFLAPTLIAGIYGMNFEHMPELHWLLGYPMAVLLMVGVSWTLWRLFKRSGWL
jgi:magnesium transporter